MSDTEEQKPIRTLHYGVILDPAIPDEAAFKYVEDLCTALQTEFQDDRIWIRLFRGSGGSPGLQNPDEFTGPERITIAAAAGSVAVPAVPGDPA